MAIVVCALSGSKTSVPSNDSALLKQLLSLKRSRSHMSAAAREDRVIDNSGETKRTVFLQPHHTLITQERASNLASVVPQ